MTTLADAAKVLGQKGGKKGGLATGDSKRRGDSDYYRKLAKKRRRKPAT